jgi:ElaB/YqjD/DUF883 family membrane-anchored ribosome-binding protein
MSDRSDPSQDNTPPGSRSGGQSGGVSIGDVHGGIHDSHIAGRDIIVGSQALGALSGADQSLRDELQRLIAELEQALQQVPADHAEEAEAVAQAAQDLVDKAAADRPNKTLIQISGEGLKKAAKNLAGVMPAVLTIAAQIISTILAATSASP